MEEEKSALQRIGANNRGNTAAQRQLRIDELAGANWERRIGEAISKQDYVFRYLTESGYYSSLKYGSVRGYTSTQFSASASEAMAGGQVMQKWPGKPTTGLVKYGVAIPTKSIRSFKVPRPYGGSGKIGWEPFTNSYPQAGSGHWPQFEIGAVPLEEVYMFSLGR